MEYWSTALRPLPIFRNFRNFEIETFLHTQDGKSMHVYLLRVLLTSPIIEKFIPILSQEENNILSCTCLLNAIKPRLHRIIHRCIRPTDFSISSYSCKIPHYALSASSGVSYSILHVYLLLNKYKNVNKISDLLYLNSSLREEYVPSYSLKYWSFQDYHSTFYGTILCQG